MSFESLRRRYEHWTRQERGREVRPGEFLESYVSYMYQSLLLRHADNLRVKTGAKVPDNRGNIYDIDVYFEFEVAGVKHRIAVECKDWKRAVTRDEAIAFYGKISDMPSTIGVFISLSGFQEGARKFLDEHGVKRLDGESIPDFGTLVAARLQPVALPDDAAVGQPFWTIMAARHGVTTGSWITIPANNPENSNPTAPDVVVPLFWSRREASRFKTLFYGEDDSSCVRGLEQPALRVLTSLAKLSRLGLATLTPTDQDGQLVYSCQSWDPDDLADEFVSVNASPATDVSKTEM